MAPDSWKGLHASLTAQVEDGTVPMEALDEAVRRVLTVKARAGLLDAPKPSERPLTARWDLLGNEEHTELAREAVRRSVVLLKNAGALPIAPGAHVLVTGDAGDDVAKLSGGWTVDWQGGTTTKDDFPQAETVLDGVRRVVEAGGGRVTVSPDGTFEGDAPDVAIHVFGEAPYAEFRGDRTDLAFSPDDRTHAETLVRLGEAGVPVVSVFVSGRPMWVNPEINASDAFVAAFLPGTQAGAMADLLFRTEANRDFTGRLSFSWPERPDQSPLNVGDQDYDPLFAYGYGLSLDDDGDVAPLSEDGGTGGADPRVLLADGAVRGGWSLTLEDEEGATQWNGGAATSPSNALEVRTADLGRQENALSLRWSGPARAMFWREPTDLSGALADDRVVEVSYVAEGPGRLTMAARDADGATARFDVSAMTRARPGTITSYVVPLSCLADAGVDLSALEAVSFGGDAGAALVFERVGVARNTDMRRCPPALPVAD